MRPLTSRESNPTDSYGNSPLNTEYGKEAYSYGEQSYIEGWHSGLQATSHLIQHLYAKINNLHGGGAAHAL